MYMLILHVFMIVVSLCVVCNRLKMRFCIGWLLFAVSDVFVTGENYATGTLSLDILGPPGKTEKPGKPLWNFGSSKLNDFHTSLYEETGRKEICFKNLGEEGLNSLWDIEMIKKLF